MCYITATEFKNNLIWNETSEFLKRYYKKKETIERIPKISEYYETAPKNLQIGPYECLSSEIYICEALLVQNLKRVQHKNYSSWKNESNGRRTNSIRVHL